jgi:hypothetical protein
MHVRDPPHRHEPWIHRQKQVLCGDVPSSPHYVLRLACIFGLMTGWLLVGKSLSYLLLKVEKKRGRVWLEAYLRKIGEHGCLKVRTSF